MFEKVFGSSPTPVAVQCGEHGVGGVALGERVARGLEHLPAHVQPHLRVAGHQQPGPDHSFPFQLTS